MIAVALLIHRWRRATSGCMKWNQWCVCCKPSKHKLMSNLNGAADVQTLLHAGNV